MMCIGSAAYAKTARESYDLVRVSTGRYATHATSDPCPYCCHVNPRGCSPSLDCACQQSRLVLDCGWHLRAREAQYQGSSRHDTTLSLNALHAIGTGPEAALEKGYTEAHLCLCRCDWSHGALLGCAPPRPPGNDCCPARRRRPDPSCGRGCAPSSPGRDRTPSRNRPLVAPHEPVQTCEVNEQVGYARSWANAYSYICTEMGRCIERTI